MQYKSDTEAVEAFVNKYKSLNTEIGKIIVGQHDTIKDVLISVFCKGHCLLVGVPGLAKTLLVNTIADALGLSFNRIQFTPDLMPSDITGSEILDENRNFKFIKGPLFANIILADEINRTPPKTQAALLEAMQERQVTIAGKKYEIGNPFFVLATQNPIEQEGTYPLPEAQSDRFLLKLVIGYPTFEEETIILDRFAEDYKKPVLRQVLNKESLMLLQDLTRQVPIATDLKHYIVELIHKTRNKKDLIEFGASPRATIGLTLAAKARALLEGRKHVSKEDIFQMAYPVLRHRIILTFEAERQGLKNDDVIKTMLK